MPAGQFTMCFVHYRTIPVDLHGPPRKQLKAQINALECGRLSPPAFVLFAAPVSGHTKFSGTRVALGVSRSGQRLPTVMLRLLPEPFCAARCPPRGWLMNSSCYRNQSRAIFKHICCKLRCLHECRLGSV